LGLADYYRGFVKDFARIAKSFDEMTRKDMKWNWKERQQRVFEKLKKRFMMKSVLVTLDLDKEIRLETDAFDFAIEGMLLMKCENEK